MIYRNEVDGSLSTFSMKYRMTDILVGTESGSGLSRIREMLMLRLGVMYSELENIIEMKPGFGASLTPWDEGPEDGFIGCMVRYTREAEVGPMAAVAGSFADELLNLLLAHSSEGFVENGGDVAIRTNNSVCVSVYSGSSSIGSSITLEIPPGRWGIASSSGRFGHSLSLGDSDVVTVVSDTASRADAYATRVANEIVEGIDPEDILERYRHLPGVLIVWNGNAWFRGRGMRLCCR